MPEESLDEDSSWINRAEYVRESTRGHNHDGDPLQVEVDVTVDKALKMAFLNPMATNRSIIAAATEGISDEVRFALDIDKLSHRLSLVKMKLFPEGSTDPSNLRIPDLWRTHVDGSPFVMFDSEEETGQKRMIIMSSLYMLDKFSQSSSIAGDGTFYSRPVGWRQVYAWHLRLRNTFVPAVVVFMGDRTENTYSEMLRVIAEIIRQNFSREWNVLHVMTDYEPAIRLAVFKHFGGRVNHLSCYFHFSYCITKKLKKLKLKKKSDREAPFCQFIRQFRILPLLPVNQVMAAFADLTNFTLPHRNQFAEVPRLQEFFDYMRLTWIGGLRRNGEAFSPRFPIRIWNHNSSLMQDNPKTTSVLESWHRTINAELRKRRAHKYWSIHCIVRDELYKLFSVLDRSAQRRPALQGIPVLQRAVNDFDSNQVNMSLARITEAAYSNRWNRPTSLKNGGIAQQQPVAINVPGINQNLANRRRGWFNAPIIQRNALVPYDKPELQDQRIN